MIIERRVTRIEPNTSGFVTMHFECKHTCVLQPSKGETSEQKAARFADALGQLYPCETCTRKRYDAM